MGADPVGEAGEPGTVREPLQLPDLGRSGAIVVGVLFWGWLLLRWTNDWLLPPGLGVPVGQPFLPVAAVESTAARLAAVAGDLGAASGAVGLVGGVVGWVAGVLDAAAFAIGTMPALAQGAWLTIILTTSSIVLGFFIAVPLAIGRVYGGTGTRWLSLSYTELIRGTPLLAQLFVLFFGLGLTRYIRAVPGVGQGFIPDQAVWVAIIGFIINSSAYQSEYIRSALLSVEGGQLTAARAIGLSRLEGIRYVVLPQGLRYAIPGWSNELVYLIKYSSLAAFITVPELFFRSSDIASETFRYTAMFTLVALMYLALVLSASTLMTVVEERVRIPGLGSGGRES